MTSLQKYNNIINSMETITPIVDKEIAIYKDSLEPAIKQAMQDIQQNLDVSFDLSYDVMYNAVNIISEHTIKDLPEADFFADADSRANVYTGVQLSYLSLNNESDISDLMKDESITSIAQACSIWHSRKVVEACEALRDYILN